MVNDWIFCSLIAISPKQSILSRDDPWSSIGTGGKLVKQMVALYSAINWHFKFSNSLSRTVTEIDPLKVPGAWGWNTTIICASWRGSSETWAVWARGWSSRLKIIFSPSSTGINLKLVLSSKSICSCAGKVPTLAKENGSFWVLPIAARLLWVFSR